MPEAGPMISPTGDKRGRLAGMMIVLAAWAAYANSFSAPFVFDDLKSITLNPTLRQLWPPGLVLSPPPGGGLAGRPLVNLSFALNYAFGGESVWGYHAVNLALHALAALVLFGIARRTLVRPAGGARTAAAALWLAGAVAVLWAVHPLQTEAVTYVSQRTEGLMGLCYLLTVYAFIRGVESPRPARWLLGSAAACLLGAASKEVIVTAPLLVLLYDRTFAAGSFRAAWRQRWPFYLGLAASWLLLAFLMRDLPSRHVGFGLGVSAWTYALTEGRAIVQYLALAAWPHPLVFDYGAGMAALNATTAACALLIGLLVAGTVLALRRWPALGFAGAWFFLTLAPASSVVPVVLQPVAEHRMYLPLAGVVALVVVGGYHWLGRGSGVVAVALAVALGGLTAQRNRVYGSELALWSDTVAKRPVNARARTNLGSALALAGRLDEARAHFAAAVRLDPAAASAQLNLGNVLLALDRPAEALAPCAEAVRLAPDSVESRCALGATLARLDRTAEALGHFQAAVRLDRDSSAAHFNLATALFELRRFPEAEIHYAAVVRLQPEFAGAHCDLGNTLVQLGRLAEARAQYEAALRLDPDLGPARLNLAQLQALEAGRPVH
jgi:tetratricopeptide (TPR) repeat protein